MNNDHSWILYTVAPTFAVIQFPLIQSVTHYARSVTPVTSKSLDPYITDRLERPLFTMVIPLPSVSETLENLRRPSHTAFNVVYSWFWAGTWHSSQLPIKERERFNYGTNVCLYLYRYPWFISFIMYPYISTIRVT